MIIDGKPWENYLPTETTQPVQSCPFDSFRPEGHEHLNFLELSGSRVQGVQVKN